MKATIRKDAFGEYRVRFYEADGSYCGEGCDYFTDDKADAEKTAALEIAGMERRRLMLLQMGTVQG